jgi:hypothetical protein
MAHIWGTICRTAREIVIALVSELSLSHGLCFGRKKQRNLENSLEKRSRNSLLFSFSRFGFGGWEQKLGDANSK